MNATAGINPGSTIKPIHSAPRITCWYFSAVFDILKVDENIGRNMLRPTISIVLILLLVLAPTFCQAHSHEAALSNDRDGTAERSRGPLLPPHFHAHHFWFLNLLDSDHDAHHESDGDDHDSLPGQAIAAMFSGSLIQSSVYAEPLQMVSLGFVLEQPLLAAPAPGSLSLPSRFVAASDRPIYLTTLTLRL